jgi:hypothetical protein
MPDAIESGENFVSAENNSSRSIAPHMRFIISEFWQDMPESQLFLHCK